MMDGDYRAFLDGKRKLDEPTGFDVVLDLNPMLFDFQRDIVSWALWRGRAAVFADCGLGKTPMQLEFAHRCVEKTNKHALVLAPLAVGAQTVLEGEKFGIECHRPRDGKLPSRANVIVTNYERLHHFDPRDFECVVCDESSILKNFDGSTKAAITEFMRLVPYRLLCTATAAPNDYLELGTHSEALGYLGYMDMLSRFFKRDEQYCRRHNMGGQGWRFRGHAEGDFWRWVCSWARAIRKPSDLGYDDGDFILPQLDMRQYVVAAREKRPDMLFDLPAVTLVEQRAERRRTIGERCEMAASLVSDTGRPAVCWAHLNDESQMLCSMIDGAVEVSGSDSDEDKEERFLAFQRGEIRVLVTKPSIAGFGLNWQHCAHQTFFPSHSFEQFYQATRRSWRFGQKNEVIVDIITSEGEAKVLENMQRKQKAATALFEHVVRLMKNELNIDSKDGHTNAMEVPSWL